MSVDPALEAILDGGEAPSDSVIEAPPETPAEVTPDAPPPEAPEPEAPTEPEHPETVPWDDHVKLRHENEAYRKRWQRVEQAFDGVHPDDQSALLNLVRTYASNPTEAAGIMRQYAEALAANDGEPVIEGEATEPQYMTAQQVEQMLAQRDQNTAEKQAVAQIERDAVSLGYNAESEDYVALLSIASKNGGDLQAAHKVMTTKRQAIIDEYLASKKAESESTPAPQDGAAPSGEQQITSLKDADRAAREFLMQ